MNKIVNINIIDLSLDEIKIFHSSFIKDNNIIDFISSIELESLNRKNNFYYYTLIGFILGILISGLLQFYLSVNFSSGLSSKPIISFETSIIPTFTITILTTLIFSIIGFIKKSNLFKWKINNDIIKEIINENQNYLIYIVEDNFSINKNFVNVQIKIYDFRSD